MTPSPLLTELGKAHSRGKANQILAMVEQDHQLLDVLMEAFFAHEEIKIIQRAAMVVGDLGRKRPNWLVPYHARLLAYAEVPPHPAVTRNIMRYFGEFPGDFAEELEGRILDLSLHLTADLQAPVASRVFSMSCAHKLCKKYPDISPELRAAIEGTFEHSTAGFKSRGRKILRSLDKLER